MGAKMKHASSNKLKKSGAKYILRLNLQLLSMAMAFFIAAGDLLIKRAWIYFGIGAVTYIISSLVLIKYSPELLNERAKIRDNTKSWDKILIPLYLLIGFYGTHIVAGLDIGRFKWSELNMFYIIPGIIIYIIATVLSVWAMIVNKHFEATVRIQSDRDHKVIKEGPYKIIRHPGYLSALLTFLAVPLMIGSLYAFFCTAIVMIIMVIRTALEDKTLQLELKGYSDYSKEVKYRLIPLIW